MDVLEGGFKWLQRAALDCEVTAPLVRLVAFLALKLRLRVPAAGAPGRKTGDGGDGRADIAWLDAVYVSCQGHIIEFLERLAEAPAGAAACSTMSGATAIRTPPDCLPDTAADRCPAVLGDIPHCCISSYTNYPWKI